LIVACPFEKNDSHPFGGWLFTLIYRGCQKNVPIAGRFSATTPYAAILFPGHYYDKRYKFTTSGVETRFRALAAWMAI